jgi:septal ring-binding cell division protein DamX
MKSSHNWLFRQIAACLVVLLAATTGDSGLAWSQQIAGGQRSAGTSSQNQSDLLATSAAAAAESALPENPEPVSQQPASQRQATDQNGQSAEPQADRIQQQSGAPQPVGTAAAPYEKTMGIAASRPAGAAIAPAKQRRVRTILISVGVIVGAGVAIGAVAGLSRASASRP